MWIFLNNAFLSVVRHRSKPGFLLVRARSEGDIELVFQGAEVDRTDQADYRYRAVVEEGLVAAVIAESILGIDYDNFKGSIPSEDHDRHEAYMDVWSNMHRYQTRGDMVIAPADLFEGYYRDARLPLEGEEYPGGPGVDFAEEEDLLPAGLE